MSNKQLLVLFACGGSESGAGLRRRLPPPKVPPEESFSRSIRVLSRTVSPTSSSLFTQSREGQCVLLRAASPHQSLHAKAYRFAQLTDVHIEPFYNPEPQVVCGRCFLFCTRGNHQKSTWVVVKIIVPFWIPIIIRNLIFRVPKKES